MPAVTVVGSPVVIVQPLNEVELTSVVVLGTPLIMVVVKA